MVLDFFEGDAKKNILGVGQPESDSGCFRGCAISNLGEPF